MRSSLCMSAPKPMCIFYLVFFTVDRKPSQTNTFSQNIIYVFCLYPFSVKCIIKKHYLISYGPLKPRFILVMHTDNLSRNETFNQQRQMHVQRSQLDCQHSRYFAKAAHLLHHRLQSNELGVSEAPSY